MKRFFLTLLLCLSTLPAFAQIGGPFPGPGTPHTTSGGGCTPGTTATIYFARVTMDTAHQTAYCNFLNTLDSDSITPLVDVIVILGTQTQAIALNNLVSSSFTPTINGSGGTFTANAGFIGVAGTQDTWIDTGFTTGFLPSTQFQTNSAHFWMWSNTNTSFGPTGPCGGVTVSGGTYTVLDMEASGSGNSPIWGINDPTEVSGTAPASTAGFWLSNRSSSTATQGYYNTTLEFSGTQTGTITNGGNIFITAANFGGGNTFSCNNQIAAYGMGASLNSTQIGQLEGAVSTLATALSWP